MNEEFWSKLREELAAIEHDRWAHWQSFMHSKGQRNSDGSMLLGADLIGRWESQIKRSYSELSDAEKDSDREQVDKYLPLIRARVCQLLPPPQEDS